jgi:transcription elongation factor Elf1
MLRMLQHRFNVAVFLRAGFTPCLCVRVTCFWLTYMNHHLRPKSDRRQTPDRRAGARGGRRSSDDLKALLDVRPRGEPCAACGSVLVATTRKDDWIDCRCERCGYRWACEDDREVIQKFGSAVVTLECRHCAGRTKATVDQLSSTADVRCAGCGSRLRVNGVELSSALAQVAARLDDGAKKDGKSE